MGAGSVQLAAGHFAIAAGATRAPHVLSQGLGCFEPVLSSRFCHRRESVGFNPSSEHPASGLYLLLADQQPSLYLDYTDPQRQILTSIFFTFCISSLQYESWEESKPSVVRCYSNSLLVFM